jgi:hypothetical protein
MRTVAKQSVALMLCVATVVCAPPALRFLVLSPVRACSGCDCNDKYQAYLRAKQTVANEEAALARAKKGRDVAVQALNSAYLARVQKENAVTTAENKLKAEIEALGIAVFFADSAAFAVSTAYNAMMAAGAAVGGAFSLAGFQAAVKAYEAAVLYAIGCAAIVTKKAIDVVNATYAYYAAKDALASAISYYNYCVIVVEAWDLEIAACEARLAAARTALAAAKQAYDQCIATCP